MKGEVIVIGVDCAAQSSTVGLALGVLSGNTLTIDRAEPTKNSKNYAEVDLRILAWIKEFRETGDSGDGAPPILLALDAPLGWPVAMGSFLRGHAAGEPTQPSEATLDSHKVGDAADKLFQRHTDQVVTKHTKSLVHRRNAGRDKKDPDRERTPRSPLNIGADKIARVAHASLCLLARLRDRWHLEIPLAWEPGAVCGVQAIEVYPAATLQTRNANLLCKGYKKPEAEEERVEMLRAIKSHFCPGGSDLEIRFENASDEDAGKTDHALDAVVCCLAAADFMKPDVVGPKSAREWKLAKREGWIWVAEKGQSKP